MTRLLHSSKLKHRGLGALYSTDSLTLTRVLLLFLAFPLFGCVTQQTEVQIQTKYVCPDRSITDNPENCFAKQTPSPTALPLLPEPTILPPPKPSVEPPSSEALGALEKQIIEEINTVRGQNNLPALVWSERAASAARKYMKTLADQGRFAHQGAEGSDVHDRLFAEGLHHFVANENLAQLSYEGALPNASTVVTGWLKSPGHRSNILDVDKLYDHAGVGAFCTGEYCNFAYTAVALSRSSKIELEKDVFTFIYLNDPGYGFNQTLRMRFQIADSNYPLDAYFLPNSTAFEQAKALSAKDFEMRRFAYFKKYESIKNVDDVVNASVGTGVMAINVGEGTALFAFKASLEEA